MERFTAHNARMADAITIELRAPEPYRDEDRIRKVSIEEYATEFCQEWSSQRDKYWPRDDWYGERYTLLRRAAAYVTLAVVLRGVPRHVSKMIREAINAKHSGITRGELRSGLKAVEQGFFRQDGTVDVATLASRLDAIGAEALFACSWIGVRMAVGDLDVHRKRGGRNWDAVQSPLGGE